MTAALSLRFSHATLVGAIPGRDRGNAQVNAGRAASSSGRGRGFSNPARVRSPGGPPVQSSTTPDRSSISSVPTPVPTTVGTGESREVGSPPRAGIARDAGGADLGGLPRPRLRRARRRRRARELELLRRCVNRGQPFGSDAEGQRRYVESLRAYARQFVGQMQKPKVEHIEGLSPAGDRPSICSTFGFCICRRTSWCWPAGFPRTASCLQHRFRTAVRDSRSAAIIPIPGLDDVVGHGVVAAAEGRQGPRPGSLAIPARGGDPTSLDSPVPTVVGTGVGTELIEERSGVIHML